MKKYKEFMDGVKASDTLHQRLLGLETPGKRPIPWKRYGTMAAAVALVLGLGGLGYAHYYNTVVNPTGQPFLESTLAFDPAVNPDIALVSPGELPEPGQKTLGGYEVTSGSGENAMTTYYILPFIDYGKTNGAEAARQTALDWDIPKGASKRDLTQAEITSLLGGEDAVDTHLDWDGYELTGWAAWYEDGSFWGAYLYGYQGPLDHFEFAVTAGHLPPTCIAYSGSVTQEIRGLTITADGHDSVATPSGGVDASSRRVSFMKDDYGYRFDLTGTSRALTEERVSRLVCRIADKGLALTYTCPFCGHTFPFGTVHNDPMISAKEVYVCADCGQTLPVGTKHSHPHIGAGETYTCEICGRDYPVGSAHSHPFIGVSEPNYEDDAAPVSVSDSPRSRGEDWCGLPATYICPDCGQTVSVEDMRAHVHSFNQADQDDAMCSGYPVPEVCPICGQTLPAGMEHSHEVCHLPLAPDPAESWEISDGHPLAPEGWTRSSNNPD